MDSKENFLKGASSRDPLNLENSLPKHKNYNKDPLIIPSIVNVKNPLNLILNYEVKNNTKPPPRKKRKSDFLYTNNFFYGRKTEKTKTIFTYGNYPGYYNYRNPNTANYGPDEMIDPRLYVIHKDWIMNKKILDVGCNDGSITIFIAKKFKPSLIVGLDIDSKLIKKAKYEILRQLELDKSHIKHPVRKNLSKAHLYPLFNHMTQDKFPYNVEFDTINYVPECPELLTLQHSEYDVIFLLSVSKWVHFNWGDSGLKLTFQRIYKQLNPKGLFVFEPQEWGSYLKGKKKTGHLLSHIKFKPEQFKSYLLHEVGFNYVKAFLPSKPHGTGFSRTIYVYVKCDKSQVEKYVCENKLEGGEYAISKPTEKI